MKKKNIIISSHVVYVGDKDVFGPGHAVSSYLTRKKIKHTYIRHSLYKSRPSEIVSITPKGMKIQLIKFFQYIPGPLRFFFEAFWLVIFLMNRKTDVFIAVDPVNAFGAVIGKRLGRINTLVFYTADYAKKRFPNPLFNAFYHFMDRVAITNADVVWSVSSRIQAIRKEQGVNDGRNVLVPNTPLFESFKKFRIKDKKPNSMIVMANFTPAIGYPIILQVIKDLVKKYKNLQIGLIGRGELEEKVRELVADYKIEKHVAFLGFMDHDTALKTAAHYKIGLAPYASLWPWTEYGDSLKAREYMALGLPVIISDNVSTADDIVKYKAGYSIPMTKRSLMQSIDELLGSRVQYASMQKNALRLAKDFDLEKILDREFYKRLLV